MKNFYLVFCLHQINNKIVLLLVYKLFNEAILPQYIEMHFTKANILISLITMMFQRTVQSFSYLE